MTAETTRRLKDVYFDAILHNWLEAFARRERWRVAGWYGVADLVQDGYICYCKCRDKYTLGPPEPGHQDLNTDVPNDAQRRHFMALVQRAFFNHLMTLSTNYPIAMEEPVSCAPSDDSALLLEGLMPPAPEETTILMALANAPVEIGAAIGKLINDGVEGEAYLRSRLRRHLVLKTHASGAVSASIRVTRGKRALRETTSAYFQRVLGDGDLPRKVAAYIHS